MTISQNIEEPTSRPLLIHVGYVKTGSTWLQRNLFSDPIAGFYAPWGAPAHEAIEQFVIVNPLTFDAGRARAVFASGTNDAQARSLVPVVSHEMLAGDPARGQYWEKEAADRIHATFPAARIFISIREQRSMILSLYREYVKGGGTYAIRRFIGRSGRKPGFAPICQFEHLEYDLLIAHYQKLFGPANVCVLPFELLKTDRNAFVTRLMRFARAHGTPSCPNRAENVGLGSGVLALRRALNRVCTEPDFSIRHRPLSYRISSKCCSIADRALPRYLHDRADARQRWIISQEAKGWFSASNERVSKMTGIDLFDLGYEF